MSMYIGVLCWLPYFYHKDTHRIMFKSFHLLWGVRYKHLCDFHSFKNVKIKS